MRRYYLKINDTIISCVNALTISKTWRNEVKQTNLEGDNIIDRGNKKYRLSINIGIISSSVLSAIENAIDDIFFSVSFYEDNNMVSKIFSVASFDKPSPIYYHNKRLNGVFYENVTLDLEER